MARGPSRRRHHRRTRDIAAPPEGLQVPPPTDVQVAHPEGVQRLEATAGDLEGMTPWPQVLVGVGPIVLRTSRLLRGVYRCHHRPMYKSHTLRVFRGLRLP